MCKTSCCTRTSEPKFYTSPPHGHNWKVIVYRKDTYELNSTVYSIRYVNGESKDEVVDKIRNDLPIYYNGISFIVTAQVVEWRY